MTVYALAQLTIHDRARYARYVSRFPALIQRFGGHVLAADTAPEIVEGAWKGDKVVLLSFESAESFWAWARSDEYRAISEDRVAATTGPVLLLHGIE